MDKFKEMKEKAIAQLGILAETPVENTEDGVCHALKRIFNHGTWDDGAKKDAKIGKLEAQLYTDQEINKLRQEINAGAAVQQNFNATVSATLAATVKQTNELASVFGSYIKSPIMSVSEAVMNAAKAAAAPASTTAGGAGE